MDLIIVFGPTGAGKTYLGKLLKNQFGYFFYDGDSDLNEEMKQALQQMRPITNSLRDRFMSELFDSIERLLSKHPKLVVAQTFIKEKHRRQLLNRWTEAKFLWVKTSDHVRYQRRQKRTLHGGQVDYPWNEAYVKAMDTKFDLPQIPHQIITNDNDGSTRLKASLRSML